MCWEKSNKLYCQGGLKKEEKGYSKIVKREERMGQSIIKK